MFLIPCPEPEESAMSEDYEEVWLSDLKLATAPSNSQPSSGTKPRATEPDENQARTTSNPVSSAFGHLKPLERLAEERIGDELKPDASIWQLYLEEAKEYDDELVDGENNNLDQMLLFAALFSTVLSAFLMESKNMLQQDPADASVALLLLIAQSQQRIEQGTPQPVSAPIELPNFAVSMSARWINGLWFLALALSLSAALVSMLAKEWLAAFTGSRPRPAHAHALLRQARLVGLTEWRALHIINLLPSILHLSLLLFSLGLVLYLWTLDSAISAVIVVVTGATFLFYISSACLAAIYELCPFVTEISKYIRLALDTYARDWLLCRKHMGRREEQKSDYTTRNDIRALAWLVDNARDPNTVEYTCLCLSGANLPNPKASTCTAAEGGPRLHTAETTGGTDGMTETSKAPDGTSSQHTAVQGVFSVLCTRLSQAPTLQTRELDACQGANVARYACALPQLVQLLEPHVNYVPFSKSNIKTNGKLQPKTPAQTALSALDNIWSNECPALSSDSYALLTSAELRLVTVVKGLHYDVSSTTRPESPSPAHVSTEKDTNPSQDHVEVPMGPPEAPRASPTVSLFDLRARYSRALSRAGYLLRYHDNGHAPIGADALIYLLDSIRKAAQCSDLNPESHLSTHQPQSHSGRASNPCVRVIGINTHSIELPDIGDEDALLVGLLRLASAEVQPTLQMELALAGALSTIAPILLKQWLKVTLPHRELRESEHSELSEAALVDWPVTGDSERPDQAADLLTHQVIAIAAFTISHAGCRGVLDLPEQAMLALYRRFQAKPGHSREAFYRYDSDSPMGRLIRVVDSNSERLDHGIFKALADTFMLKHEDATLFKSPGIDPNLTSPFLRILSKVPDHVSGLQTLLTVVEEKVQRWNFHLIQFTDSEEGFSALLKVGEHEEYRLIVAKCVAGIIRGAVSREMRIEAQALQGLLDAVSFALGALQSDKEGTEALLASTCNLELPLDGLPDDTQDLLSTHTAVTAIKGALQAVSEPSEKQENLLAQLEKLQSWSNKYNLPPQGLAFLFE